MNFLLAHDQVVLLETAANLWARRSKANDFFAVFCLILSYTCRRYNKTLNDWSSGKLNSEFCFPSTSIFLSASTQERLRVLGKQNSLFILGPVIKCLLSLCLKLFWIMWKGICGQVSINTLDRYPWWIPLIKHLNWYSSSTSTSILGPHSIGNWSTVGLQYIVSQVSTDSYASVENKSTLNLHVLLTEMSINEVRTKVSMDCQSSINRVPIEGIDQNLKPRPLLLTLDRKCF